MTSATNCRVFRRQKADEGGNELGVGVGAIDEFLRRARLARELPLVTPASSRPWRCRRSSLARSAFVAPHALHRGSSPGGCTCRCCEIVLMTLAFVLSVTELDQVSGLDEACRRWQPRTSPSIIWIGDTADFLAHGNARDGQRAPLRLPAGGCLADSPWSVNQVRALADAKRAWRICRAGLRARGNPRPIFAKANVAGLGEHFLRPESSRHAVLASSSCIEFGRRRL